MKWIFRGLDSMRGLPDVVEVEADDESTARHLAMVARWGSRAPNIRPNPLTNKYEGSGLILESVE